MGGGNGWQRFLVPYDSPEERSKDTLVNKWANVCPSILLDEHDEVDRSNNTYRNTYLFDGLEEDRRGLDRSWHWGSDVEREGRWDYLLAGRW